MEVFIGRQPIFNIHEKVFSYELLYRSTSSNTFSSTDADGATVDVLVNSFLNIGIDEITKGKPGFINFTENLLNSPLADFLNPDEVVIEILEDVQITPSLIERVKQLKAAGFKIALDDFILEENIQAEYEELFTIIDYLKVDFLLSPLSKCIEIEHRIKKRFPHITLLAEKVETREQLEAAKQSGYELFQGYFFEKPQVIKTSDIPTSTLQYFEILSLLNEADPDINALAKVIERDISLSYKLLQVISVFTKRNKSTIYSIKHAIVKVGFIELRKWIYLLAMRENNNHSSRDTYIEIMRSSLFRAKVCEKLASHTNKENYSEYYLVGMFSLMDTLLQRPMDAVIEQLPFSEIVSKTIKGCETEITPFLQFSIALGRMNWEKAEEILQKLNIKSINLESLYYEANEWADKTTGVL